MTSLQLFLVCFAAFVLVRGEMSVHPFSYVAFEKQKKENLLHSGSLLVVLFFCWRFLQISFVWSNSKCFHLGHFLFSLMMFQNAVCKGQFCTCFCCVCKKITWGQQRRTICMLVGMSGFAKYFCSYLSFNLQISCSNA